MSSNHRNLPARERNDGVAQAAVALPPLNPFCTLGPPHSPLRMMFAPFEVAAFLPAYAIDTFHGRGRR